jgi:hypothetical protein
MSATLEFSEAAIFGRLVETGQSEVSADLARHILNLTLSPQDEQRIDQLLQKSVDGSLSDLERAELENLNHIADLISLWHSKARRVLSV